MDEQVSWKGQSFTLLVFGGIVFLCSIFFVLGMLVGRGQGQRAAEAAATAKAAKEADAEARLHDLNPVPSSFETITTGREISRESKPRVVPEPDEEKPAKPPSDKPLAAAPKAAVPAPVPSAAQPKTVAPKAPAPQKMIYLQVYVLEKEAAARKEVDALTKKGFPALLTAGGDKTKAIYRVQVGPFSNASDADVSKRRLQALGYTPILK